MQKEWGQRKIETERGDREGKRHYQQQDGSAVGVPVMGMCHTLGSLAALGQARPHRLGSHGWPHTRAGAAEPRAGSRQDHGTGLDQRQPGLDTGGSGRDEGAGWQSGTRGGRTGWNGDGRVGRAGQRPHARHRGQLCPAKRPDGGKASMEE